MGKSRKKMTVLRAVLLACVVPLLLSGVCIVEALRYPRIARSAYLASPWLLVRATCSRVGARGGVAREEVLGQARKTCPGVRLSASVYCLSNEPKDDKCIRDRVFGLIAQRWSPTDEELFWVVRRSGGTVRDWMVYEYRTGRLVCQPDELGHPDVNAGRRNAMEVSVPTGSN